MTTGDKIKEIRLGLYLSMDEFGRRIDERAKSGTVSNWETGKNLPNKERLRRIAELGNITVEQLLSTDDLISIDDLDQRLNQILDLTYNLIFTSVNLTVKQKELLAEIRELASEE